MELIQNITTSANGNDAKNEGILVLRLASLLLHCLLALRPVRH